MITLVPYRSHTSLQALRLLSNKNHDSYIINIKVCPVHLVPAAQYAPLSAQCAPSSPPFPAEIRPVHLLPTAQALLQPDPLSVGLAAARHRHRLCSTAGSRARTQPAWRYRRYKRQLQDLLLRLCIVPLPLLPLLLLLLLLLLLPAVARPPEAGSPHGRGRGAAPSAPLRGQRRRKHLWPGAWRRHDGDRRRSWRRRWRWGFRCGAERWGGR